MGGLRVYFDVRFVRVFGRIFAVDEVEEGACTGMLVKVQVCAF